MSLDSMSNTGEAVLAPAQPHLHTLTCGCEHGPQTPGSIRNIESFILELNRERSEEYMRASASRQKYRARHSTEIAVFKCMDGRLNAAVMTETPPGILRPFRNIGARFNLGWPYLGRDVHDWVQNAVNKGRDAVALTTYHFSKGDPHRGCKGFNYDTDAARGAAEALRDQFLRTFPRDIAYPVVVGIETDEDALIFHSVNGETFNIADAVDMSYADAYQRFTELYPDMLPNVREDLLQLVLGNQRVIKRIRQTHREPVALNHREQVVVAGGGVDYLHLPNLALIVGPFSPDWEQHIVVAGNIVLDNIQNGRVDSDAGRLLLVSALSRHPEGSIGWNVVREKVLFMRDHAYEALQKHVPELLEKNFSVMGGVVAADTRRLHRYF